VAGTGTRRGARTLAPGVVRERLRLAHGVARERLLVQGHERDEHAEGAAKPRTHTARRIHARAFKRREHAFASLCEAADGATGLAALARQYSGAMVHLRIVAPPGKAESALEMLESCPSVINVIVLPGAARKPDGDVILCDVAREDASVVIEDLRALDIHREGSIAVELVDTAVSHAADVAVRAAEGDPSDAVIWEEVTERTSESASLSAGFVIFMVLAAWIAAVGIYLDSPILVVGAMVVGPEFGPIAGFCVAAVQRRPALAARSFAALAVGFPLAIVAVLAVSLVFKATGITPESFSAEDHSLARTIAAPDFFAAFVAFSAGVAGILSLTTAKSGALIGVLISVTTIPAASNVGVAAAYADWSSFRGSLEQLALNVAALLVAGTGTLLVQRAVYRRRRAAHARRRTRGPARVERLEEETPRAT
jgi:uncharacterized hydrophobic protein (TIGR00271 family)